MTRFALGGNCNLGSTPPIAADSSAFDRSFSNDASAATPIPVAVRPKKWRRVRSFAISFVASIDDPSGESPSGHCFIQIQNDARDACPRGQFRGVELFVTRRLADAQKFLGRDRIISVLRQSS